MIDIGERIAELEQRLGEIEQFITMTESLGWAFMAEALEREMESIATAGERETNHERWMFLRGQLRILEYILSLPNRVQVGKLRLVEEYRSLVGEE